MSTPLCPIGISGCTRRPVGCRYSRPGSSGFAQLRPDQQISAKTDHFTTYHYPPKDWGVAAEWGEATAEAALALCEGAEWAVVPWWASW